MGEAEEEVEVVVLVLVVDVVGLVLVVDVVILVVDVNDVVLLVVVVEPVDFKHLGAARKPEVSWRFDKGLLDSNKGWSL